jgi:hypothetical protein
VPPSPIDTVANLDIAIAYQWLLMSLQVSTLPLPIDTPISPIVAYFSYQHYYYNPKKKKFNYLLLLHLLPCFKQIIQLTRKFQLFTGLDPHKIKFFDLGFYDFTFQVKTMLTCESYIDTIDIVPSFISFYFILYYVMGTF